MLSEKIRVELNRRHDAMCIYSCTTAKPDVFGKLVLVSDDELIWHLQLFNRVRIANDEPIIEVYSLYPEYRSPMSYKYMRCIQSDVLLSLYSKSKQTICKLLGYDIKEQKYIISDGHEYIHVNGDDLIMLEDIEGKTIDSPVADMKHEDRPLNYEEGV